MSTVAAEVAAEKVDDDLWSAIGDPTRRRMLDLLLVEGDGTATTLGRQLPVTRQAVAKHLGVLDRAGLVRATPAGREKRYRVDDAQLARAVAQLSSVGSAWDARLRRIKRIAEAIQSAPNRTDNSTDNRADESKESRDGGHSAQGRGQDPA
jgi:DNA-binding transcriptional ArsR family regulator